MEIIPAVDLIGGRAVRLYQGRKADQTVYHDDPVVPAIAFAEAGARYLHVVDLDGAFGGGSKNLESVRRIAGAVGDRMTLELGGGLRTFSQIEKALDLGVDRVILGTVILADPEFLGRALDRFGPARIVVGLDASGGKVAIRGWEEITGRQVVDLAQEVEAAGAERLIYTDISRDGAMRGPNLPALKELADSCKLAVIASGGISSLEDVRSVAGLEKSGVEAMIIGKALYEGKIDLKAALGAVAAIG